MSSMSATSHSEQWVAKTSLAAQSIGYLVPRSRFDGVVQSVYAGACNIAYDKSLFTLMAPGCADGPATLRLDRDCTFDLRTCFRVGDAVVGCGASLRSRRADVDLSHAIDWKPETRPALAGVTQVAANLGIARERLAARYRCRPSILHREAWAACAMLEQACRTCELETASDGATRLVGWGEGSTPAGDDFLVGLMGGLHALAGSCAVRRDFLTRLSARIETDAGRTVPIAAHYLRLAARGHFTADVLELRNALLSANGAAPLQRSLDEVLALGASSGADLVAGFLSGIGAWLDPPLSARSRS